MAHPHDLTIADLMKILAEKTLQAGNTEEFEKLRQARAHIIKVMSTDDIVSACTLLPDIFAALRQAANSRARVNSLPPEILLRIFAYVPQAPQLTTFDTVRSVCGPLTTRQVWELGAVTQVCHRWRALAFNVSSLWSSAFRKSRLVSRCGVIPENASYHSRCIAGPLQMYVEEDGIILSKWEPLTPVDAPLGYEDRVEELHVVTVDGWKHGILPPSLLSPRLNSLQRLIVRSLHSGTIEASGWQWHGLQPVFQGQTLPLRSLAIIDSPFLPSNPVPALARLVLFYDMKREMRETWSHRDLLNFLSAAAPTLEEAVICGIPLASRQLPGPTNAAHLDRVRKLSIRGWDYRNPGSPRTPFPLLAHIVVPQRCFQRLDAGSVFDVWTLAAHLEDRQPQWDAPPSAVHCVWASSPYTMSSLQATLPPGGGRGGGGIRVDFRVLPDRYSDGNLPRALCTLLERPPFAAAQALWVSGSGIDGACEQGLTHSLGTLRGVKALYVVNDPQSEPGRFVKSLGIPAPTLSSPPELPFPILETLCVTVYDRPGVEKLAEMLRRRAAQSCKLIHLLVRCAEVGDEEGEDIPILGELDLRSALRGAVEKVTVLSENDYRKDYALRTVLPPLCILPGGGLIWPPWTENETTFALMHLT
ncbi:hypothetical protein V8D89_005520 [Ganoderma adspersum]